MLMRKEMIWLSAVVKKVPVMPSKMQPVSCFDCFNLTQIFGDSTPFAKFLVWTVMRCFF